MTYQFHAQKEPSQFYSEFDEARESLIGADTWQGEAPTNVKIKDDFIYWVQESLNTLQNSGLRLDGDLGGSNSGTLRAVRAFERSKNLPETSSGPICPKTELALSAAVNKSLPIKKVRGSEPLALTLYVNIPLQISLGKATAMTGIFVPENYCRQPQVDLIVYLHGFKVRLHDPSYSIDTYWSLPQFRLREEVNLSQKNVILVAPTLGPASQSGSLRCKGGFDRFLEHVMVALQQFGPYTGLNKPTVGNIILACHSGSGDVMRTIATGNDVAASKIQECWAFEPSASIGSANQWKTWAQSRPNVKLYIYYLPGTAGKSLCQNLGARPTASGQVTCAPRIVAEQAVVAHDAVPARYFQERIKGASFLIDKSSCAGKQSRATPSRTRNRSRLSGELWQPEYGRALGGNSSAFGRPGEMEFETAQSTMSMTPRTDWGRSRSPAGLMTQPSPFELESTFEYEGPATVQTAKQIFASQSNVKELVDANFWNIFSDRNKVIVVAFWSDSCRSCADAATAVTSMANRFSKGPAGPVKFYHVQWDPRVNPRVHRQFGFRSIPVVFFYYTSTGRPPSKAAPLLEGSLGHNEKHDPNRYVRTIEAILRRHAPPKTRLVSERRGWKKSTDLISKSDFADIDQLLVEPSPFQQYLLGQYRANPGVRLSKLGIIQIKSTYDATYQTVNGRPPESDNAGTLDKKNLKLYLLSVNIQFQTYLGRTIHEAIHMFCCPVKGTGTKFHNNYGFGITEGFTQYITEQILKSQKLTIIQPSPYKHELAAVTSLVRVVGVTALAEDYFLCNRRVFEHLNRINKYSQFWRLSRDADEQREKGSERGMIEAYQKLIRFLDAI